MLNQPSLFDVPPPPPLLTVRRTDPDTAVAAAEAIATKTTELEDLVLEVLYAEPGGLTTHEIAQRTDCKLVTISPRMRPLARRGLVVDSGERSAGDGYASSIVWKATT